MNVLIGCEFSGIVRDAFIARGHNALSVDLEETESKGPHVKSDIFAFLNLCEKINNPPYMKWDLLIFHWPCTNLCNSGVRWLFGGKGTTPDNSRWGDMEFDAHCFHNLLNWNIPKICGENPIPHQYARKIMGNYTQTIHPWQFGHGETKTTCLWLKNLPELKPTLIVNGRNPRVHYASPGPNRWKERSRTYTGIAKAMAEQWG